MRVSIEEYIVTFLRTMSNSTSQFPYRMFASARLEPYNQHSYPGYKTYSLSKTILGQLLLMLRSYEERETQGLGVVRSGGQSMAGGWEETGQEQKEETVEETVWSHLARLSLTSHMQN